MKKQEPNSGSAFKQYQGHALGMINQTRPGVYSQLTIKTGSKKDGPFQANPSNLDDSQREKSASSIPGRDISPTPKKDDLLMENRGLSDFFKKDDINNPFSRSTS